MSLEEEMIQTHQNRSANTARRLICALAVLLALCAATFADSSGLASAAPPQTDAPQCATGVDLFGFSDALNKRTFEGTNVGGLSGLTYDASRDVYHGLVDNEGTTPARFYTLRLPTSDSGLGKPRILNVTTLKDVNSQPFTGTNFDGEGIALTPEGELLVSSETEPSIRRFALDGTFLGELPVPERFLVQGGEGRTNQTFESLSLSPNGQRLLTANEGYLHADGETADGSDRIRILRYENRGSNGFVPVDEFYYLADPGLGVVEIVALSEDELLVMERGFQSGVGNTVRIYRVSLEGAKDVSGVESLAATNVEPLQKELLVDLSDCPSGGAKTAPGAVQANPLLDNFEALTLGPVLPDGRQSLVLVSDDNFNSSQTTRVIVLAVEKRVL
jgi:hypothetical protein